MALPVRLLAFALVLVACLARPAGACEMARLATVPLMLADGRILVDLEINGRDATFQLDTGAARSVVTPEAVRRLELARDRWVGSTIGGIGGIDRRSVADTTSLTLAGIALHHRDGPRDSMLPVAVLGAPEAGGRIIDGLLGRDFLSAFDVALNVGARTMTLWRVQDCAGRFLPRTGVWSGAYDAIQAAPAYGDALVLMVRANGAVMRALPDTGASETLIAAPGMVRLGLAAGPSAMTARGIGTRARPVAPLRLSSLRVGEQTTLDVPVLASNLRVFPIVDMLLGADWFAKHHVWLSYATRQVFVSPAN
ncbi:MAG: retroviral-like aspartic protease family protein [Acetobacteraceae bacterium]